MSSQNISTLLLRVGMALVFIWFGVQQFISPDEWIYYIPEWATSASHLAASQVLLINATIEVILGTCLLLGIFTRICAFILSIHLAVITFDIGLNAIGIRDFGLTIATLALALSPFHSHSIDSKYLAFLNDKFPGFNKTKEKGKSH